MHEKTDDSKCGMMWEYGASLHATESQNCCDTKRNEAPEIEFDRTETMNGSRIHRES